MKLMAAIVLLVVPLQASEWALGLSFPLYGDDSDGGIGLWRTGEKWGYGMTLRGPAIDLSCCKTNNFAAGSLTIQRFKGRMFFFGETRGRIRSGHNNGVLFGMRIGAGIHRKYKDFGLFISHGLEYEGFDGDGIHEIVGLQPYPRVVVYWTL